LVVAKKEGKMRTKMKMRDHLESYVYSTASELKQLGSINWPQDLEVLEKRISSLEEFINEAVVEIRLEK
jgi:hypothetical protein